MLITFEGIDGSGKSTQISLLKEKLMEDGRQVEVFREPGGTRISEMVRKILLDPELDMDPVTELLLFSSARSQLVAEKVQPLLEQGTIVILDRFYDSTVAYQGYGRESLPIEKIHQVNEAASHGLVPDVTIYLRITPKEAAERTKNIDKDRMERSGDSFFQKVFQGFEKLAEIEPRFKVVHSNQEPEKTHRDIMKVLEPLL